jgi:Ca2+-binding EF-hand superfamily protein
MTCVYTLPSADNGSGTMEIEELEQIAIELGEPLTSRELDLIMNLTDADDDGSVEFNDFVSVRGVCQRVSCFVCRQV